jgi:hypothetical protein
VNQYGQVAQAHWKRYRPAEYARISDRETFFRDLGNQIEQRILDRADALEQAVPAGQPFQARWEQMMAARPTAEREVLAEMLPAAEDDETGE